MEGGSAAARKVMVVADPGRESAGALQYALSHAVRDNDTLFLLHVENPAAWKNPLGALFKNPMSPGIFRGHGVGGAAYPSSTMAAEGTGVGEREVDFLDGMRRACSMAKPKMAVVVEKVEMSEGKDKAAVIIAHSEACKVDLLIIGQRMTTLTTSILSMNKLSMNMPMPRRGLSLRGFDTADYVVENCRCTCVAVQKKGQHGGYLLNSKTQKNFWLLA